MSDWWTNSEADAAAYERTRAEPDDDRPTPAELYAEDLPHEPVPHYVCDGCMRVVAAPDVGEWADFEHVLCRVCCGEPDPWTAQEVRPR